MAILNELPHLVSYGKSMIHGSPSNRTKVQCKVATDLKQRTQYWLADKKVLEI